jgi:hypothetical protein
MTLPSNMGNLGKCSLKPYLEIESSTATKK